MGFTLLPLGAFSRHPVSVVGVAVGRAVSRAIRDHLAAYWKAVRVTVIAVPVRAIRVVAGDLSTPRVTGAVVGRVAVAVSRRAQAKQRAQEPLGLSWLRCGRQRQAGCRASYQAQNKLMHWCLLCRAGSCRSARRMTSTPASTGSSITERTFFRLFLEASDSIAQRKSSILGQSPSYQLLRQAEYF